MADVNGEPPPRHVAHLLWTVLQRARADGLALLADDPDVTGPLTAAHARLLDHLPPGGARVTDLAGSVRITKQAHGQLGDARAAGREMVEQPGVCRRQRPGHVRVVREQGQPVGARPLQHHPQQVRDVARWRFSVDGGHAANLP